MLLAGYPDAASFLAELAKVYVYDTRADLCFKNANGSTGMTLVQEGGAWKLAGE